MKTKILLDVPDLVDIYKYSILFGIPTLSTGPAPQGAGRPWSPAFLANYRY